MNWENYTNKADVGYAQKKINLKTHLFTRYYEGVADCWQVYFYYSTYQRVSDYLSHTEDVRFLPLILYPSPNK